jgi:hypothetical protein
MFLNQSSYLNPEIKEKIRKYLDVSKKIDRKNKKYQKLEALFSEFNLENPV